MAGNNSKSIVTDAELRVKIAVELAKKINELIKQHNPDATPEELFDIEEVREYALNGTGVEIQNGLNNIQNKLDVIEEDYSILSKIYEEEKLETVGKLHSTNRFSRYRFWELNTIEDYEKAEEFFLRNHSFEGLEKVGIEVFEKAVNSDLKFNYPTREEEITQNMIEDPMVDRCEFVATDVVTITSNQVVKNIGNDINIFQNNYASLIREQAQNPLSLLLPNKSNVNMALLLNDFSEIRDLILKLEPDIKEFEDPKLGNNTNYIGGLISPTLLIKEWMDTDKEKINLINSGLLKQGYLIKQNFFDKDDKKVSATEALKHIKDGAFTDGFYTKDKTEEELKAYSDNNKLIDYKANFTYLADKYLYYKRDDIYKDSEYLKSLEEFYNAYKPFYDSVKGNKDLKESLDLFDKFNKDNEELLKSINEKEIAFKKDNREKLNAKYQAKMDRVNAIKQQKILAEQEKQRQAEENKNNVERYTNNLTRFYNENQKSNYKTIALLAEEQNKQYDNIEKDTPYASANDKFKTLLNSKFNTPKSDINEKLISEYHKPLTMDQVMDRVNLINLLNKKDKEYNNRGAIGKWWYKKSHHRMEQARDKMVADLSNFGFINNALKALGKDNMDPKNIINTIYKGVLDEPGVFDGNIKALYSKYIETPAKLLKEYDNEIHEMTDRCFEYIKDNVTPIREKIANELEIPVNQIDDNFEKRQDVIDYLDSDYNFAVKAELETKIENVDLLKNEITYLAEITTLAKAEYDGGKLPDELREVSVRDRERHDRKIKFDKIINNEVEIAKKAPINDLINNNRIQKTEKKELNNNILKK